MKKDEQKQNRKESRKLNSTINQWIFLKRLTESKVSNLPTTPLKSINIRVKFVSSSFPLNQVSSLFCLPACQRAAWLGRLAGRAVWLGLILSATGREWSEREPTNCRPAAAHSGCQPLAPWAAFQLCSSLHTATDLRHWSHLRWCVWVIQNQRESQVLCVLSLGISLCWQKKLKRIPLQMGIPV